MAEIDLTSVWEDNQPVTLELVPNAARSANGDGDAHTGFAEASTVEFSVAVSRMEGDAASVTVVVEMSEDGESWSTVATLGPLRRPNATDSESLTQAFYDYVRATWTVSGGTVAFSVAAKVTAAQTPWAGAGAAGLPDPSGGEEGDVPRVNAEGEYELGEPLPVVWTHDESSFQLAGTDRAGGTAASLEFEHAEESGAGGEAFLRGGHGAADRAGGRAAIIAGNGNAGMGDGACVQAHAGDSNGNPGRVEICTNGDTGGDGKILVSAAGEAYWTDGIEGIPILLPALPTVDPAVVGQLWSDAGTLKISAGP